MAGRRTDQVKTDENRTEQLKTIAAEFCRVHVQWCEDPKRNNPDAIYWDAANALVSSFQEGDIPGDCRDLQEAVAEFSIAVDAYDNRDTPENQYPPSEFWKAVEAVQAAMKVAEKPPLPPLESIPSLAVLPGITTEQICKIYGFRDRHGNWMPQLVQRELDKPGSVIDAPDGVDGRKWRDPRLPPEDGNTAADRHSKAIAEKRQASAKSRQPCPESPKDLWEQKVPVAQAAKMLVLPETEVAQLFGEFDQERENALLAGDVVDAQTQAIREMKSAGKSIKQIANELKISEKDVADAIRAKAA
jgi:hypothetical protein